VWGSSLCSPLGVHMRYMVHLQFSASNNVAEYEALGIRRLDIWGDS
jgi:hypothetical protein